MTKKAKVMMLAGGPLFSLLLAALFFSSRFSIFGLTDPESEFYRVLFPIFSFLFYFNLFQFLFTAIPMRYKVVCRGLESDGLQIVRALKHERA